MTSPIRHAHDEVAQNRVRVERAFRHLERSLGEGRKNFDRITDRLQIPERLAQDFPWAVVGICTGIGFLFGLGWVQAHRRESLSRKSTTSKPTDEVEASAGYQIPF